MLLLSGLAACGGADGGDAFEGDPVSTEEQVGQDPAQPPYDSPGDPANPCAAQVGTVYTIDGREVFVPAACNPNWMDMGDPAPEILPGDPTPSDPN